MRVVPKVSNKNSKSITLNTTKMDLSEEVRREVTALLQDRLADAVDFKLQSKQAHWNIKGPNFIALHELFDKIATDADEYADLIAERIVQLGGTVNGLASVALESRLKKFPIVQSGPKNLNALTDATAAFAKSIRSAIDEADEFGDADTADILTQISRELDKYLWFLESHL